MNNNTGGCLKGLVSYKTDATDGANVKQVSTTLEEAECTVKFVK